MLLGVLSIITLRHAPAPLFALLPNHPIPTKPVNRNGPKRARLFAVVVHIGRGPNHGHYVAVVKSGGRWLLFDDEIVELVNEQVGGRARMRFMPSRLSSLASRKPSRQERVLRFSLLGS